MVDVTLFLVGKQAGISYLRCGRTKDLKADFERSWKERLIMFARIPQLVHVLECHKIGNTTREGSRGRGNFACNAECQLAGIAPSM